jgi:hypothetical protein
MPEEREVSSSAPRLDGFEKVGATDRLVEVSIDADFASSAVRKFISEPSSSHLFIFALSTAEYSRSIPSDSIFELRTSKY